MNLLVRRMWYTDTSTCGTLDLDGIFFCYTLERQKPQPGMVKPYAIPTGRYFVLLQFSEHFQMTVPHLQNVPGFEGIEIHPANWPSDLKGCLGVGSEHQEESVDPHTGKEGGAVFGSRVCFASLMEKLKAATDAIFITYQG